MRRFCAPGAAPSMNLGCYTCTRSEDLQRCLKNWRLGVTAAIYRLRTSLLFWVVFCILNCENYCRDWANLDVTVAQS